MYSRVAQPDGNRVRTGTHFAGRSLLCMATKKQARRAAALTVATAAAVTLATPPVSATAATPPRAAAPAAASKATATAAALSTKAATPTKRQAKQGSGVVKPAENTPAAKVPTATAVTPASGPVGGGTAVTITGSGFNSLTRTNPAAVKFGSANASSFIVVSDTSLIAVAPAGTNGAARITVTNGTGASTGTIVFAYRAPLGAKFDAVTGAKPTGGTVVPVTVTGGTIGATTKEFAAERITAKVGDATATVAWVDPAHVNVTAPASTRAAGLPIRLIHDGVVGEPSTTTVGYAPALTTIAPSKISTVGGTTVTITGTGFSDVSATDPASVKFGDVNAVSFAVKSATQITAVAPPGVNGAQAVSVKAAGGKTSTTVTYRAPLGLEVPATAVAKATGGTVTLKVTGGTIGATAKDFATEGIAARVGDLKVTPTWVDSSHVKLRLPASNAASANVTLLHDEVAGAVAKVNYVPAIVSLSANNDVLAGGSQITVKVAGGDVSAATKFKFGAKEAVCAPQGKGTATVYLCTVPSADQAGATWVSFTASTGLTSRFSISAGFFYTDLD
jgi:hypothetical protein